MVRVGRTQWRARSHGATGEAGNGRPPLIKEFDAVITALFYLYGQLHPPQNPPQTCPLAAQPTPGTARCPLLVYCSFGPVRYQGLW